MGTDSEGRCRASGLRDRMPPRQDGGPESEGQIGLGQRGLVRAATARDVEGAPLNQSSPGPEGRKVAAAWPMQRRWPAGDGPAAAKSDRISRPPENPCPAVLILCVA